MRVFIDTNILISAALFPTGVAAAAYNKAVTSPCEPMVSDYVIDELRRVFVRKFPQKMTTLDSFLAALSSGVRIVDTPEAKDAGEDAIRDPNDRPVLRAARSCEADVLLTGDKDLLEAGVDWTSIVTAGEFVASF